MPPMLRQFLLAARMRDDNKLPIVHAYRTAYGSPLFALTYRLIGYRDSRLGITSTMK